MIASASKDALRKALNGVALEIQGTDYDEVSEASGEFPLYLPFPPLPPFSLFLDPFLPLFAY